MVQKSSRQEIAKNMFYHFQPRLQQKGERNPQHRSAESLESTGVKSPREFLRVIGLLFTSLTLLHLLLILRYGAVRIIEPRLWILIPEVIMMGFLVILFLWDIREGDH